MKKSSLIALLLGIVTLSFISCDGDDGNDGGNSSDPIVGTWKHTSEKKDGVETATACDLTEVYTFNADGTAIFQDFDDEDGACVNQLPAEAGVTVTWERNAPNDYQYQVFINGSLLVTTHFTTEFAGNQIKTTAVAEDGEVEVNTFTRQ